MSAPEIKHACQQLVAHGHNLSVAESVTSGLLQNCYSNMPEAINFFEGGLTVYNLKQKAAHLKINVTQALSCNCVSEQVAIEMAAGVKNLYHSDWSIAVTGYASPVPEMGIDKLFACYAIQFKEETLQSGIVQSGKKHPREVQEFYTELILSKWAEIVHEFYKAF